MAASCRIAGCGPWNVFTADSGKITNKLGVNQGPN